MQRVLLTRNEAAEFLGVSYSSLARWASQRVGPAFIKIGGAARYHLDDLNAYIVRQRIQPVAQ